MGSVKKWILFGYLWLTVGFFTGTLTLLGPVRWITEMLRNAGYTQTIENGVVRVVMVVFVAFSALLAFQFTRWVGATQKRHVKIGIRLIAFIFSLLTPILL